MRVTGNATLEPVQTKRQKLNSSPFSRTLRNLSAKRLSTSVIDKLQMKRQNEQTFYLLNLTKELCVLLVQYTGVQLDKNSCCSFSITEKAPNTSLKICTALTDTATKFTNFTKFRYGHRNLQDLTNKMK